MKDMEEGIQAALIGDVGDALTLPGADRQPVSTPERERIWHHYACSPDRYRAHRLRSVTSDNTAGVGD